MSDVASQLKLVACDNVDVLRFSEILIIEAAVSEIATLTAELSALRAKAEKLDTMDGMDGAACHLIRQKLDEFGAPRAAFIDDHVANGIVHAKRLALEEAAKVDLPEVGRQWLHHNPSTGDEFWLDSQYFGAGVSRISRPVYLHPAASIRALMVKP